MEHSFGPGEQEKKVVLDKQAYVLIQLAQGDEIPVSEEESQILSHVDASEREARLREIAKIPLPHPHS